ncbi:NAD(P)-dependent oxidoreductase [Leifsonia sp. NPDC058230]|uniref:NAD(P)-dependent oxidoreductase n=1 Tax=Leifsonia sp. NPDC058230 TaxID=3346391 RepID=UPI0036DC3542
MRIAFIGLGIMGMPMARNLLRAGHEVVGFNRSVDKVDAFVGVGGFGAASVAEAVTSAEVVITMLPDSPDVAAVYRGDSGILASVAEGALLIDMSTIRPDVARALSAEAGQRGIESVDAPVSGGEAAAVSGSLSVMVGGSGEAFDRARPLLEAVGSTVVHVGASGAGQTVKAANQLLVGGTIELVAEAIVFLAAHGVDVGAAVSVLRGGLAGSAVLDRKAESMMSGNFAPGFRVALHHKDLGIFSESARDRGVFAPLGAVVAQLMGALRITGGADADHTALLTQVDRLSGRSDWVL